MSQEQEPTTEARSGVVTQQTIDIVERMARQIHRQFCTVGEFEACQNYYCIESWRVLAILKSLAVVQIQETPMPPILKEFDVMALAHHDADGHALRNISICHDEVCRKRLKLRNELERLLSGNKSEHQRPALSKKKMQQARRREKRAVMALMPYRDASEWADSMAQIKEVPLERGNKWQLVFCGYAFPARPDKGTVEKHAADLKRVLRKKLRHYGAQEKRALCAIFGQRKKEGRDILRPELSPSSAAPEA